MNLMSKIVRSSILVWTVSDFGVGVRREEMANVIKEEDDNLSDLDDDDEVSGAIISEDSEHFILRAQLWIEANKEYLREQRGNTLTTTSPPSTLWSLGLINL